MELPYLNVKDPATAYQVHISRKLELEAKPGLKYRPSDGFVRGTALIHTSKIVENS